MVNEIFRSNSLLTTQPQNLTAHDPFVSRQVVLFRVHEITECVRKNRFIANLTLHFGSLSQEEK